MRRPENVESPFVPKALFASNKKEDKTVVRACQPKAKYGDLSFSSDKTTSLNSSNMKKFVDALQNSNTKLEVFHMVLTPEASYDIWGFSLKDNDKYYWSWKPGVLERIIDTDRTTRFFDQISLNEMLFNVRAASVRETPCGPNVSSGKTYGNGQKFDNQVLFGLLPHDSSESDVRQLAIKFCEHFRNIDLRGAYSSCLDCTMKNNDLKKDAKENGFLWAKLDSASKNIVYQRLVSMNQICLDHKIEEIIRYINNFPGGESNSMWPRNVRMMAFGMSMEGIVPSCG